MPVDDSYSKALLHFDGSNTSTTFTDESGKTWTAAGNAQLNTSSPKFGTASGLFDGTGDYISTPDSADFDVGAGNFTVDCWFKRANSTAAFMALFSQDDTADTASKRSVRLFADLNNNKVYGDATIGSSTYSTTGVTVITDTNWHHVALVRNGINLTIYLDGTQEATRSDLSTSAVNNSDQAAYIGSQSSNARYLNGRIDELRFSKGIARWTGNFTPPVGPYPVYSAALSITLGAVSAASAAYVQLNAALNVTLGAIVSSAVFGGIDGTSWSWAIEAFLGGVWVDISADAKWQKGISAKRGLTGSSPTDRVATSGSFTYVLNNGESNTAKKLGYYSPQGPNCRSGFDLGMRTRLKLTSGTITRYVYHGRVANATPVPGRFEARETPVIAVDYMEQFNIRKLNRIPVQVGKRTDQIMPLIIGIMPIAPLNISLDVTPDTFDYALQDEQDEKTYSITALQKAAQSDRSYIYVNGNTVDGETLRLESRNTRTLNRYTLLVFSDDMAGLDLDYSSDAIYNDIHVPVSPSVVDAAATTILATLPSEIMLNPSETKTVSLRLVDPSGAGRRISGTEFVDPMLADTHYKMSSISGDGGNDRNAYLTVAYLNKGANTVDVNITNTGASAGYVNKLNIVGKGIYLYQQQEAVANDTTSSLLHGDHSLTYQIPYQGSYNIALDFANEFMRRFKNPFTKVNGVTFNADANSTFMLAALTLDIGDRITLAESTTGLNADFFINGVEFNITAKRSLQVRYVLELASVAPFCVLNDPNSAVLDVNAYLAF